MKNQQWVSLTIEFSSFSHIKQNEKALLMMKIVQTKTPLSAACWGGHVDIAQILIDHPEIDINKSVS